MAYGLKYYFEFIDKTGDDYVAGQTYRVEISQNNYVGSSEEITPHEKPFRLNHPIPDTREETIHPTSITLNLIDNSSTGFKFDVFASDEREFRVDILVEGVLWWRGWLVQDNSLEPLTFPPYTIELVASDGLNLLENIPYAAPTDSQNLFEVIRQCMDEIGLELPYYMNVNVYDQLMNSTTADDPFVQADVDPLVFIDDEGEPLNCLDILRAALVIFAASIRQWDGHWQIIKYDEILHTDSNRVRRLFDKDGVYQSVTVGGFHKNELDNVDIMFLDNDPEIDRTPAARIARTIYNFGAPNALFANGSFEEWSASLPVSWSNSGGSSVITQVPSTAGFSSQWALRINTPNGQIISGFNVNQTVSINQGTIFTLKWWQKVINPTTPSGNITKYRLQCGTQYLVDMSESGGKWSTTQTDISVTGLVDGAWNHILLSLLVAPETANMTLTLFQAEPTGGQTDPLDVDYDLVETELIDAASAKSQRIIEATLASPGTFSFQPDDILLLMGDAADSTRKGAITVGGVVTSEWERIGETEAITIDQVVLQTYLNNNYRPFEKIQGNLYGRIDIMQTLTIDQLPGKEYIFLGGEFDPVESTWEGSEWIETTLSNQTADFTTLFITEEEEPSTGGGSGGGSGTTPVEVHNLGGAQHSATTLAALNSLIIGGDLDFDTGKRDPDILVKTEETTPGSNWMVLVEDSGTPGSYRKVAVTNFPTSGGGETNTMSNQGTGVDVFKQKTGVDFELRTFTEGDAITLTQNTDDIQVSIADGAITNAKLADVATDTIKGRTTAGSGDVEDLTPAQVRTMINVADGAQVNVVTSVHGLTGAVDILSLAEETSPTTGHYLVIEISAGNFRRVNISNLPTGGSGEVNTASNVGTGVDVFKQKAGVDFEFRTLVQGAGISLTENTNDVTIAIADDGVTSAKIADSAVLTAAINNDAVTNAKLANMAADTIKGRQSTTGDPTDLTAAQVRTLINVADGANNYTHPNHSGDVTSVGDGVTTIAALAVTTGKLANDAVTTAKITDSNVTEAKLASNAVTSVKIAASAVTSTKLAIDSVTTDKIAALAVSGGKIANSAITSSKLADLAVTVNKIGSNQVNNTKLADMTQNTIKGRFSAGSGDPEDLTPGDVRTMLNVEEGANDYVHPDHTGHVTSTGDGATTIADGVLVTSMFTASSVTTGVIANDAVTNAKIADLAVDTAQIAALAVQSGKIEDGAVINTKLGTNSVTAVKINASAVTTDKIADLAVIGNKIAALTITTGKIQDDAITTDKIADSAVINSKIGTNAITAVKINANAVTEAKIQNAAVTTDKLADLAVTTAKIADSNITSPKLGTNSVTQVKINANAVTNAKLADMAEGTVKARTSPGSGDPEDIAISDFKQNFLSFPTFYKVATYFISNWNMDNVISVIVTLSDLTDADQIRHFHLVLRSNANASYHVQSLSSFVGGDDPEVWASAITDGNPPTVTLSRKTGGSFDNSSYNAANAYLTVHYIQA